MEIELSTLNKTISTDTARKRKEVTEKTYLLVIVMAMFAKQYDAILATP